MELDEIKKTWNEMETLKANQLFSENRIREMMKSRSNDALAKLMKISKFYMFAAIPLGLTFCLFSDRFFKAGGYYIIYPLIFMLFCILLIPFEMYLYRILKGIDFAKMTVREVSERILKYQNAVRKFQTYGTVVAIMYLGIWYFLFHKLFFGSEPVWEFIIFMLAMLLAIAVGIPFLYNRIYYKKIRQIQESLQELKDFDNIKK
jgi:F0F1-type ATP synthase assembly protein I